MADLFPHPLLETLGKASDRPVVEHGSRVVSRGELLGLIRRLAAAMRAAGLGPGTGVAVRTEVTPEALAAHLALHTIGCRVVGVRPGYPPAQLAHVLSMGVEAVLVDRMNASTPHARTLVIEELLTLPGDGGPLEQTARPGDVALLAFTSGSTGRPKGCAFTYRALGEHWAWQPRVWSPVAARFAEAFERYLLFGTLASMVVLEFVAPCLLGGGVAVIPEDDGRPLFPHAIERHRITGAIITVPRLHGMLQEPGVDVSSLKALMVSGSPISPARLAQAAERLGPVLFQGYGQTEAGSISMLTPEDLPGAADSVGRPHPNVEVAIRDGEVHVRSPYMMTGYWGAAPHDGWINTRDLGRMDGGFLRLDGRTRDVIMVNAMVVYAGPIERVLASHPGVAEAYVAGAPDDDTGEAVHAFVMPAADRAPDQEELAALVRRELGADHVPKTVTVVTGVPVAPSGKPDKRALLGSEQSLRNPRQQ
ncbi:class I adenylate-forming enzyme family protein [Nonomuraea soli]|uniref:Acyl-CoA synthetase (AMP-forming)/AMP-acid ligase II n=1 Tax=Nonomuraea soli TaxID=1032476 RepID=A0A7W0HMY8_9ACTN|nr:fatty acid--CoA ligase family protein [Nonomuraea soli]MBA2889254.1 acyl-CoA synthetase (AMP-forming)/AMP-acid ligase II [Nonomuraea soli]